jgi:adenine phosphoribosyltransferase
VASNLDLTSLIRTIPDFPQPGVQFRDITTLLKDAEGFHRVIETFAKAQDGRRIDKIAGIESRGFIVGAALACRLRVGFVPIRKHGKLPAENFGEDYALEYGRDRLEMHRDAMERGERVLLVDDLIATGGTALAATRLIEAAGATLVGCAFVIDLPDLGGRRRLESRGFPIQVLCEFSGD